MRTFLGLAIKLLLTTAVVLTVLAGAALLSNFNPLNPLLLKAKP